MRKRSTLFAIFLDGKVDVEGHYLLTVSNERLLKQRMTGLYHVEQRLTGNMRFGCPCVAGKLSFRPYEVDMLQQSKRDEHLLPVRTDSGGYLFQYAYHLLALVVLELTDAVIGLYHLSGLDKHRLTRCRLVVNDARYAALQSWGNRYNQTTVAHRGGNVFLNKSFRLC